MVEWVLWFRLSDYYKDLDHCRDLNLVGLHCDHPLKGDQ
jgi:hypothetical protein